MCSRARQQGGWDGWMRQHAHLKVRATLVQNVLHFQGKALPRPHGAQLGEPSILRYVEALQSLSEQPRVSTLASTGNSLRTSRVTAPTPSAVPVLDWFSSDMIELSE